MKGFKDYIDIKEIKNIAIYAILFQTMVILIQMAISTGIFSIFPSDEIIVVEREPYIYFIWAIIFAPIIEELIFRKGIYRKLKKRMSVKKSIIISSLIFGVIHINPVRIIFAFFAGYNCCLVYDKYKTLIAPIIFHSICNAIGLINGNFLVEIYINKGIIITAIYFIISIVLLVFTIRLFKKHVSSLYINNIYQ